MAPSLLSWLAHLLYHGGSVAWKYKKKIHEAITDTILRDHGFRILLRPRVGQPIWIRLGRQFLQRDAEEVVREERR